jgi:hypothetical protein
MIQRPHVRSPPDTIPVATSTAAPITNVNAGGRGIFTAPKYTLCHVKLRIAKRALRASSVRGE